MCVRYLASHFTLFLCREYEENGEIKKETKYSYGKLINRKSFCFYACSFGLSCVSVLNLLKNIYFFFCWERKLYKEISKDSVC